VVGEFSHNPLYIRKVDVSIEYFDYLTKFEQQDKFKGKWGTKTLGGPRAPSSPYGGIFIRNLIDLKNVR